MKVHRTARHLRAQHLSIPALNQVQNQSTCQSTEHVVGDMWLQLKDSSLSPGAVTLDSVMHTHPLLCVMDSYMKCI